MATFDRRTDGSRRRLIHFRLSRSLILSRCCHNHLADGFLVAFISNGLAAKKIENDTSGSFLQQQNTNPLSSCTHP
jgi:hypothetical protein